jgi:hypothetical protein
MGFLDNTLEKLKDQASSLFDPFEAKTKGSGGGLGGLSDTLDDFLGSPPSSGVVKPQFASKEEAEVALFTSQPEPVPEDSPDAKEWNPEDSDGPEYGKRRHIRKFVRDELLRREMNRGMYYTHGSSGEAQDELPVDLDAPYTGTVYKGPKTAWCRVCSNRIGKHEGTTFQGFILNGVNNFKDIYGFTDDYSRDSSTSVLGYDVDGQPHTLEEKDFLFRPSPGLTSVDSTVKSNKQNGRETTLKISCHSRAQVDYLHDYFFSPGITIVVEWGWNNYPRESLIDLTAVGGPPKYVTPWEDMSGSTVGHPKKDGPQAAGLVGLFEDPELQTNHIKSGRGNYMFVIGMVTSYEYAIRDDAGYDCTVTVSNVGSVAMKAATKKAESEAEMAKADAADEGAISKTASSVWDYVTDEKDGDDAKADFKEFWEDEITDFLEDDPDAGDSYDVRTGWGGDYQFGSSTTGGTFTKGRYFNFDDMGSNKKHLAGNANKDFYITLGLFIDIVNVFFSKVSQESPFTSTFNFSISGTRCVAHPDLKSINGDVLLIPNTTSPNYNNKGSSHYVSYMNKSQAEQQRMAAAIARTDDSMENMTLEQALQSSPRDNLHELLAEKSLEQGSDSVHPFPDYKTGSDGYSGRAQDLFVNVKVIQDAVFKGTRIQDTILDVLKQMSEASGGIWNWNLGPSNNSAANDNKICVLDNNCGGDSVDKTQREKKTWIFRSHQKNSVISGLSMNVKLEDNVSASILYDSGTGNDENPQSSYYARGRDDRLLKKCGPPPGMSAKDVGAKSDKKDEKKEQVDEKKYIVEVAGVEVEMVDDQPGRMTSRLRKDNHASNNVKFNTPINTTECEISLQGLAGIRILDVWNCTGIPTFYFQTAIFQTKGISDSISDNNWTTKIIGACVPNSNTDM